MKALVLLSAGYSQGEIAEMIFSCQPAVAQMLSKIDRIYGIKTRDGVTKYRRISADGAELATIFKTAISLLEGSEQSETIKL